MDRNLKENVNQFNKDAGVNGGYLYTTNNKYSSLVAYRRQTRALADGILFFQRFTLLKTLIDIGCGDGSDAAQLEKQFPKLLISAFDPAKEAIASAKEKTARVNFYVGNILDAKSLPQANFDLGYLHGVLHHVSDPQTAIQNCSLLTDRLVILEPNGRNPILKIIERTSQYHRDHEEQSFSPKQVQLWCENAGYRVVVKKYIGFIPFFFPLLPAKLINFIEPALESIPIVSHFFAGTCVFLCEKVKQ